MRRSLLLTALFLTAPLLARTVAAQVTFTSPHSSGILQVRGDHADLHLRVTFPGRYTQFRYKLSSDIDTTDPRSGWSTISIQGGAIDTLFEVPRSLRSYSIYWSAGVSGVDTGGIIAGLTPGHIIGIAGQSNAQGNCYTMLTSAEGDIRMFQDDLKWKPAHEPTGGVAGGPWIVMANELYATIGDTLPVGIVNAGFGATGLTKTDAGGQWLRNPAGIVDTTPYGRAIRLFKNAGGEMEALCWIQGESDGGYLPDPNIYRVAFGKLMYYFKQDLQDTFTIFHSQVGGRLFGPLQSWPTVREAERQLPPSILVGTALGRSIDDEFHYSVPTNHAIGRMFAGAILKTLYGISAAMYPPLVADSVARIDSITDGSIPGHYCLAIDFWRDGKPADLTAVRPDQYFAIYEDGMMLDTSKVWFRLSPRKRNRVLIGLRDNAITLDHNWKLTYDAIAPATSAPIATIDSGDTIFAVGFDRLPVVYLPDPQEGVRSDNVPFEFSAWGDHEIHCLIRSNNTEPASLEICNETGSILFEKDVIIEPGEQEFILPHSRLTDGAYWVICRDKRGRAEIRNTVIFH